MREQRGRLALPRAAALVLALAACTPATSPAPSQHAGPPDATAVGTPMTAPIQTLDPATIDVHVIDARYVPADATLSAAGQILWTAGAQFPSEIWRYVPGAAEPERVVASPRARSTISAFAASSRGYAFVEQSAPAFGEGGWRIWYVPEPGADPVEVARGLAKLAGSAPTIAMDDRRIAWAAFDEPVGPDADQVADRAVSRLATAPIDDVTRVTTVLELPVRDALLWYPALHGDELWYSRIDPGSDPGSDGPEYHVESVDLAQPGMPPTRLRSSDHDFDAVADDHFVIWKTNVRGDAALNWGTLTVLDRGTHRQETIPEVRALRPSLGDRFVAFREITGLRLVVLDTTSDRLVDLDGAQALAALPSGPRSFAGQSISGRLFAFSVGRTDPFEPPRIGWALLPE